MPRTSGGPVSSLTLPEQTPYSSPFFGLPSPSRRSAGGGATFAERFRNGIGDYAYKFAEQMEEEMRMLYASQMMEHASSQRSQSGHTNDGLSVYAAGSFFRAASGTNLLSQAASGATQSEAIMGCTPLALDIRHSQMDPLSAPELARCGSPLHRMQSRFDKESPSNRVNQNQSPARETMANSLSAAFVPTLREELVQVLQENFGISLGSPGRSAQHGNVALQYGNVRDVELKSRFVMRLDSPIRLVFEFISVVALFHDITVVPFILAFNADTEGNTFINAALISSLGVWTLDIFMNFFTGYVRSDGEVEMSLSKIAVKYLRTWFTADCAIVLSDWTSNILSWTSQTDVEGLKTMRLIRVARVSRLFRIMTLVRLLKMSPLLSRLKRFSPFSATSMSVAFQALQILFVIVWINHISSCVWFALGRAANENFFDSDTGETWLYQEVGSSGVEYADIGKLFQYTTSMHWSLTQMTPGSMSVVPRNSFERIWNIICLIFGLLFGTSLVGQLSSKMVQFNMNRQVELRRMETLRRFLRENYIRPGLATRIQEQIAERMAVKTRLSEADVEDIKHLSNQLRQQLRQETFMPYIVQHPVFSAWGYFDARIAKALCASGGITFTCVPPAHELFTINSSDDKAHLSLKGSMVYNYYDESGEFFFPSGGQAGSTGLNGGSHQIASHGSQTSQAEGKEKLMKYDIDKGAWVGEVSLWMVWRHLGSLEAVTPCEYMSVTSSNLIEVLQTHVHVVELTLAWCRVMYLQTQSEGVSFLRNMEVGQNFASVVMEMPETLRTVIGKSALHMLESHLWRRRAAGELEKEVEAGKCVLVLDGSGECIRTVPVVALKIMRKLDNKMLVLVAKFKGDALGQSGHWEQSCKLPGKKCEIRTAPQEAATQLLKEEELYPFAHRITLESSVRTLQTKDSATHGLKSQYVRTIFIATYAESSTQNGEAGAHGETNGDGEHPPAEPRPPELPSRFVEFGGLTVETMALRDKKGNWLMYCWLSDDEFKLIEEGALDEDIKALDFHAVVAPDETMDTRPSFNVSEGDGKDKTSAALASTSAFNWLTERAQKLQKNSAGSRRPSKQSQMAGVNSRADDIVRSDVTPGGGARASSSSNFSGTRASGSSQNSIPREWLLPGAQRDSQVLPQLPHALAVQIPRDSFTALPQGDSVVELAGITERDDDKFSGLGDKFDYEMDL